MKKHIFILVVLFCLMFGVRTTQAQTYNGPVDYMSYISTQYTEITKNYLSYSSMVAHSKNARKIDGSRVSMLQTIQTSIKKVKAMPPYQGNTAYRDTVVAYFTIAYYVLNDDYAKIVNMEEVAEQSYDAMEAYLLAQDIANEKMNRANTAVIEMQREFAKQFEVRLEEAKEDDEISIKIKKTAKVNAYHRVAYLIFFKSYKQDGYLMEAIQKQDINAIEQNRNTLLKYCDEGLAKLDTMKDFEGDKSIIIACKNMLNFYKEECTSKVPIMTDYYIKRENFEKIKKAFDEKPEKDRTQADVDQYNKGVNELNSSVNEFNSINEYVVNNKNKYIGGWNAASQAFLDKHMPKYK